MFCDGCGSTINPGAQFCNVCGKRIIPAAGPASGPALAGGAQYTTQGAVQAAPMDRVRRNLQLLTVLWMAYGVLRLLNMVWVIAFGRLILPSIFGAMGGWGTWNGGAWGWPMNNWFLPLGLVFGAGSMAFFAVAYLILAWALYEKRPWARTYGLVLGFLVLLRIPFGTALGIYTIWVLLPESSRREYEQLARV
jgi:hypothetical protein